MKNPPQKSKFRVQLIDGNFTFYPVAYCKIHQAYLSQGLADTHKCQQRECQGLEWLVNDAEESAERQTE